MIPALPQGKLYFSLDEVSQWVDIDPSVLGSWLAATGKKKGIMQAVCTPKRRYHRREVLWLCKIKSTIEKVAEDMVGKPLDLSPVRQELDAVLTELSQA
jgi:hypothetical protein